MTYDYISDEEYESGVVSQVTSEVRRGESLDVISTTTWNYTYDANGNITEITDAAGVVQNKYYYDELGQLYREDNRALNCTYLYEYDYAGNLLSKRTYPFTTGTPSTAQAVVNYTYGDASRHHGRIFQL